MTQEEFVRAKDKLKQADELYARICYCQDDLETLKKAKETSVKIFIGMSAMGGLSIRDGYSYFTDWYGNEKLINDLIDVYEDKLRQLKQEFIIIQL